MKDIDLDYLVLAAHPDDAELHCGGTVLKMLAMGSQVGILDFTRGEAATSGTVQDREQETQRANSILHPSYRHNLGLPDSKLQDNEEARKLVVDVIRRYHVKILIAPCSPCRHPDHHAVHQIARSAWFFSGAGGFTSDYPPWHPLQIIYHLEYYEQKPSFVVDISPYFSQKMAAIESYSTQFYTPTNKQEKTVIASKIFRESMIAKWKYYGTQINCAYGEPYVMERMMRVEDPLSLV